MGQALGEGEQQVELMALQEKAAIGTSRWQLPEPAKMGKNPVSLWTRTVIWEALGLMA